MSLAASESAVQAVYVVLVSHHSVVHSVQMRFASSHVVHMIFVSYHSVVQGAHVRVVASHPVFQTVHVSLVTVQSIFNATDVVLMR